MRDHLKIRLVLMELVIALLFFSIAVSVCIQPFILSYTKSREAKQLNQSVFMAQSIAEIYKNSKGDVKEVAEYYNAEIQESEYVLYLDDDGVLCDKENQILEVIFDEVQPDMNKLRIIINNDNKELYTIDVMAYAPQIGGVQ